MLNPDFNVQDDIIGITDMRKNLTQIVDEVSTEHSQKVIIRNGRPAVMLVNIADYQALYDRVLAAELEAGLRLALEEEKRGELIDLDSMAAEFGINPSEFEIAAEPEGYDQMIPKGARHAS